MRSGYPPSGRALNTPGDSPEGLLDPPLTKALGGIKGVAAMIVIPRGKYIGRQVGEPPRDEAEH